MDAISLSLILAVLFGGWVVAVALATGALKVGRYHPHHHENEGKRQR